MPSTEAVWHYRRWRSTDEDCSLCISNALGEGLCREAAKHHRVHRPNPGACQHGNCMAQTLSPLRKLLSKSNQAVDRLSGDCMAQQHHVRGSTYLGARRPWACRWQLQSPFPIPTDLSQLAYKPKLLKHGTAL